MTESLSSGKVQIADHVVARIAGAAAAKVPGIVPAGKNVQKGVTVEVEGGKTKIDIRVTVRYGTTIQHACRNLQEDIAESVSYLTGLEVEHVNVRVENIAV